MYVDPFVRLFVVDRGGEDEGGCRERAEAGDADGVSPAGLGEGRQRCANGEAREEECREQVRPA